VLVEAAWDSANAMGVARQRRGSGAPHSSCTRHVFAEHVSLLPGPCAVPCSIKAQLPLPPSWPWLMCDVPFYVHRFTFLMLPHLCAGDAVELQGGPSCGIHPRVDIVYVGVCSGPSPAQHQDQPANLPELWPAMKVMWAWAVADHNNTAGKLSSLAVYHHQDNVPIDHRA
jgi:hypothetical protein